MTDAVYGASPAVTATEILLRSQAHPDIVRLHMDRQYIRQRDYWPDNPDNFLKPGKIHEYRGDDVPGKWFTLGPEVEAARLDDGPDYAHIPFAEHCLDRECQKFAEAFSEAFVGEISEAFHANRQPPTEGDIWRRTSLNFGY